MSEKLRSFLIGLPFNRRANHATECGAEIYSTIDGACHYNFKFLQNTKAWASGLLGTDNNEDIVELFWKWVSDKKFSPWKHLFIDDDMELVKTDTGKIKGWILTNTDRKYDKIFNFVKNFAILCRSVTEKPHRWKFWYYLVTKKNINPTDAFYMASVSVPIGDIKGESLQWMDERVGGHWAITDYQEFNFQLNWKMFRSGTIKPPSFSGGLINGFWCDGCDKNKPFSLNDINTVAKKSKFFNQTTSTFKMDDLIDGFYRFQDDREYLND